MQHNPLFDVFVTGILLTFSLFLIEVGNGVSFFSVHALALSSQPLTTKQIREAIKSKRISSSDLILEDQLGSGSFGEVRRGTLRVCHAAQQQQLVPIVIKSLKIGDNNQVKDNESRKARKRAEYYLDTEAFVNRHLSGGPYIAPYLGECNLHNNRRLLIWKESGRYTLEHFCPLSSSNTKTTDGARITTKDDEVEMQELSDALGIKDANSQHTLAREMIQQLLSALAYCHSTGIVHRDIKPSNILVDEEAQCLRLIDFGSACDMSSWLQRKGYRGEERGVLTILYCPPEEFVEQTHPYAYDVYSCAMTWLRIVIPGLRRASEDALFDLRVAIRNARHDLQAWQEKAVLDEEELPQGWEEFFACSEGREAWRMLLEMTQYDPAKRPTAADLLMGSTYLNPTCSQAAKSPEPPPIPWSLSSHLESITLMQHPAVEECVLSDAFFGTSVTIETSVKEVRDGLTISDRTEKPSGVVISEIKESLQEVMGVLQVGDILLEIGPIDVEEADADHVQRLLTLWPKPNVRLLLRRE